MKKTTIAFCLRDMQLGGVESVLISALEHLLQNPNLNLVLLSYCEITEPVYRDWLKQHPKIKCIALYPSKIFGTKLIHFAPIRILQHFGRDIYRWLRRKTLNLHKFDNIDVFIDYYDFGFFTELQKFSQPKIAWWHSSINKFIANPKYIPKLQIYDKFVALTDGFTQTFKQKYPDLAHKITYIYNPINISKIRDMADSTNKQDFPTNYFCCVSRFTNGKDLETVIRAFNQFWLQNNRPNVQLLLVGYGYRRAYFESVANAMESAKQIVFTGATTNPYGYMKYALAHILSSVSEGLGMVLVESMAVNTINIASDCQNGPREILLNGDAGLLFPIGDINTLSKCMSDIYNNNIDIANMKCLASHSLSRFTPERIAEQITNLSQSVCK